MLPLPLPLLGSQLEKTLRLGAAVIARSRGALGLPLFERGRQGGLSLGRGSSPGVADGHALGALRVDRGGLESPRPLRSLFHSPHIGEAVEHEIAQLGIAGLRAEDMPRYRETAFVLGFQYADPERTLEEDGENCGHRALRVH
jgi:hypothetical protein